MSSLGGRSIVVEHLAPGILRHLPSQVRAHATKKNACFREIIAINGNTPDKTITHAAFKLTRDLLQRNKALSVSPFLTYNWHGQAFLLHVDDSA